MLEYTHEEVAVAAADKTYSTEEAASEVGVAKSTLLRWIRERRVDDVRRDRNNWRVFSEEDIRRIKKSM